MLAVLVSLGVWQVHRLAWKSALLAEIDRAEASAAMPLPADPPPFAKVRVRGRFMTDARALYGATVRDTGQGPRMGADLLMPLQRADGAQPVLVDRGWVPLPGEPAPPARSGEVALEGFVQPAQHPGLFSARDDVAARHFYTLDPAAIGAALGVPDLAPFTLIALGEHGPDGLYPDPARRLPRPDNNHLSYAITWFGLALALVVIFGVWARKALRP